MVPTVIGVLLKFKHINVNILECNKDIVGEQILTRSMHYSMRYSEHSSRHSIEIFHYGRRVDRFRVGFAGQRLRPDAIFRNILGRFNFESWRSLCTEPAPSHYYYA